MFARIRVTSDKTDLEEERSKELDLLIREKTIKLVLKNVIDLGYPSISIPELIKECADECTDEEEKRYICYMCGKFVSEILQNLDKDQRNKELQNKLLSKVAGKYSIVTNKEEAYKKLSSTAGFFDLLQEVYDQSQESYKKRKKRVRHE